jgi:myo-inositol-1-phosphate synthase
VLLVGLGAVSTTTVAGVMAVRKGLARPIGSLTQMGTVRLGKRTDGRSPMIKDFVPIAGLDDIVFGGWDIFEDNCYEAAKTAGVLEAPLLESIKDELAAVKPMSAVFDRQYVKRLDGPNVKKGKNKKDLAEQVIDDIRRFKAENNLDRVVLLWCGSTEIYLTETAAHKSLAAFEKGLEENDPSIPSSMIYAYAAIREGLAYANAAPNLSADGLSARRQGPQDGADAHQDDHCARPQGAAPRCRGLVLDQYPRQPRRRGARRPGVVQDQGREQEVGPRLHLPVVALPRTLRRSPSRRSHQLLQAAW